MASVWKATAERRSFPALERDTQTDVLIIGGGMAGVLTAYMLERAGVSTLLCEAEEIGGGITQNTTAKITVQHGLIYDRLIRRFGQKNAALYLRANTEALETYHLHLLFLEHAFVLDRNYLDEVCNVALPVVKHSSC